MDTIAVLLDNDKLRAEIARLTRELADADAMLAQNASKIDPSPRSTWPRGSYLEAAIRRHEQRCALEQSAKREEK